MIYGMSDIHGCYEQYKELLGKIHFSDNDLLYVLGDVVDRGPEPMAILKDMSMRPNVIPLIGNHEYMALSVLKKLCLENTLENIDKYLDLDLVESFQYWSGDGGAVTLEQFCKLSSDDREYMLEYLEDFQLYEEFVCNGKRYVLVHADIAGEDKDRDLDTMGVEDLIFTRADYTKKYSDHYYLVTGHTPTFKIGPEYTGSIYRKNNHIAIDCGCVAGNRLGVYCFDTEECIYSSKFQK